MEPTSATGTAIFPLYLNSELESRSARESFTWGPQGLLLLCGLVGLAFFILREEGLVRNVLATSIGVVAGVLAALAVIQILRRRARRVVLVPAQGQLGLYREGRFQYSFSPAEVEKHRLSFVPTLQMVVPMLLLVLLTSFLLYVGLQDSQVGETVVFAYLFLYACFGFVAVVRSRLLMVWYWIPEGKDKSKRCVGFYRREEPKLRATV